MTETPLTPQPPLPQGERGSLKELRARVGREVGVSEWFQVTQDVVNRFADATGDDQFIHVDPERAAQTPFGGPVTHGFLTLSLLAGHLSLGGALDLGGRMTVNYGLNKVRFVSPVRVGARVRGRAELLSIEDGNGWAQLTLRQTVEIEGEEKVALVAETIMRTYF